MALAQSALEHAAWARARQAPAPDPPRQLLQQSAGDALSHKYWREGSLDYGIVITDGFYDVYGDFPEVVEGPNEFPSLVQLRRVKVANSDVREVTLVDHEKDRGLPAVEEQLSEAMDEANAQSAAARIQVLATVVCDRFGGAFDSERSLEILAEQASSKEKKRSRSAVVPLCHLEIGSVRHRSLLFKVLADMVKLPCRLLRGAALCGHDGAADAMVQVEGRELVVDLVFQPGRLLGPEQHRTLVAQRRMRTSSWQRGGGPGGVETSAPSASSTASSSLGPPTGRAAAAAASVASNTSSAVSSGQAAAPAHRRSSGSSVALPTAGSGGAVAAVATFAGAAGGGNASFGSWADTPTPSAPAPAAAVGAATEATLASPTPIGSPRTQPPRPPVAIPAPVEPPARAAAFSTSLPPGGALQGSGLGSGLGLGTHSTGSGNGPAIAGSRVRFTISDLPKGGPAPVVAAAPAAPGRLPGPSASTGHAGSAQSALPPPERAGSAGAIPPPQQQQGTATGVVVGSSPTGPSAHPAPPVSSFAVASAAATAAAGGAGASTRQAGGPPPHKARSMLDLGGAQGTEPASDLIRLDSEPLHDHAVTGFPHRTPTPELSATPTAAGSRQAHLKQMSYDQNGWVKFSGAFARPGAAAAAAAEAGAANAAAQQPLALELAFESACAVSGAPKAQPRAHAPAGGPASVSAVTAASPFAHFLLPQQPSVPSIPGSIGGGSTSTGGAGAASLTLAGSNPGSSSLPPGVGLVAPPPAAAPLPPHAPSHAASPFQAMQLGFSAAAAQLNSAFPPQHQQPQPGYGAPPGLPLPASPPMQSPAALSTSPPPPPLSMPLPAVPHSQSTSALPLALPQQPAHNPQHQQLQPQGPRHQHVGSVDSGSRQYGVRNGGGGGAFAATPPPSFAGGKLSAGGAGSASKAPSPALSTPFLHTPSSRQSTPAGSAPGTDGLRYGTDASSPFGLRDGDAGGSGRKGELGSTGRRDRGGDKDRNQTFFADLSPFHTGPSSSADSGGGGVNRSGGDRESTPSMGRGRSAQAYHHSHSYNQLPQPSSQQQQPPQQQPIVEMPSSDTSRDTTPRVSHASGTDLAAGPNSAGGSEPRTLDLSRAAQAQAAAGAGGNAGRAILPLAEFSEPQLRPAMPMYGPVAGPLGLQQQQHQHHQQQQHQQQQQQVMAYYNAAMQGGPYAGAYYQQAARLAAALGMLLPPMMQQGYGQQGGHMQGAGQGQGQGYGWQPGFEPPLPQWAGAPGPWGAAGPMQQQQQHPQMFMPHSQHQQQQQQQQFTMQSAFHAAFMQQQQQQLAAMAGVGGGGGGGMGMGLDARRSVLSQTTTTTIIETQLLHSARGHAQAQAQLPPAQQPLSLPQPPASQPHQAQQPQHPPIAPPNPFATHNHELTVPSAQRLAAVAAHQQGGSGGGGEGLSSSLALAPSLPCTASLPLPPSYRDLEIDPRELTFGQRVGMGSYGEVYRGTWRGTEVAIKRFLEHNLAPSTLREFRDEVMIMAKLRHPNIVLFMGAVTSTNQLAIVTQFVARGSLFRLLHRTRPELDPRRRLGIALDIAKGMEYLHNCKPVLVHRDLKSPNLLVDKDWTVKVCDFGLSQVKMNTFLTAKSQGGSPAWMAPEILRNERCDEKSDVFSFGVILYELVTGKEPWENLNPMQVVGAVGFSGQRMQLPPDLDPHVASLIRRCWADKPHERPSFTQILQECSAWSELRPAAAVTAAQERARQARQVQAAAAAAGGAGA